MSEKNEDVSESETRQGAEPEAESEAKAETESEAEAEAQAEPEAAPKKKKKKAADPESIRDRNERVRAEAAQKRRARRARETAAAAPRRNLDASELMDDALARSSHAAWNFLRKHFNKVQWVIMAGLVGWIAYEVYTWRSARQAEKSTDLFFKALAAEMGKVGADASLDSERGGPADLRRSFASEQERLSTAKKEYLAASGSVSPAMSAIADLGAAGVAYDLGQYKEAQALYEKVQKLPAFNTDTDVKGRTLEGLGMALEAQKNEEGALKTFKQLSNLDSANFAALGYYHQARLLKAQGKNDDAIKLLDKAGEKLVLLKDTPEAIRYLRMSVMELYESLDNKKARELAQKLMPADLVKQLQERLGVKGGMVPGGGLPAPMELPPAPAEAPPAEAPPAEEPAPPAQGPLRDMPPVPDAPAPAPAPSGAP